MNRIKYITVAGRKTAVINVCQPPYSSILARYTRWGGGHTLPTMAQADERAQRTGLVRAGLRRRRAAQGWPQEQRAPAPKRRTVWQNFQALFRRKRAEKVRARSAFIGPA